MVSQSSDYALGESQRSSISTPVKPTSKDIYKKYKENKDSSPK
jgi:hypothetical protein